MIEHRICWNAISNVTFQGSTEWEPWDEEDATLADVESALNDGKVSLPLGLELALEASGFDWWAEIRETADV
jgi:hypothetical protein